jgi:hypothetical protein
MFPNVNVRSAASRRSLAWRDAGAAIALITPLLTLGCTQTPPPSAVTAAAADPHARIAPARVKPVLDGYAGARPVEPAPWTGATPKKDAR